MCNIGTGTFPAPNRLRLGARDGLLTKQPPALPPSQLEELEKFKDYLSMRSALFDTVLESHVTGKLFRDLSAAPR